VLTLIETARKRCGLSQSELARRAGTSQPTLSAYEHGAKSPTLAVLDRLIRACSHQLELAPTPEFVEHSGVRGASFYVPTVLWRLDIEAALATVVLPLHVNWSDPGRQFNLADRSDRARVYEIVLREGGPEVLTSLVDGALLVDAWDELVLPRPIRAAWSGLVDSVRGDRHVRAA